MRIALIYDAVFPYVIGGGEQRNYELARHLSARHEVSLYGFEYWKGAPEGMLPGVRYVGVAPPAPLYDGAGKRRIAEALYFAGRLGPALLRGREAVWELTSFPYFSVPVARLLSLLKGTPLVVMWHEFWGEYWTEYLGWRGVIGQLIERVALWCSPYVITATEHTRRRLVRAGCPKSRITVIPHGLDWAAIQAVAPAAAGAELVYAGRLIPHKRVDLLLRAAALLARQGLPYRLDVVGDGPSRAELERLADELGLRGRVRFLGRLPAAQDVFAHFKACRVLLQASEREGFGLTVTQALACGLPAVVCHHRDSASAELIDRPFKGRVVAATPEAIAAACRELLAEEVEPGRSRRVESAREYDWPRIAERVLAVYEWARKGRHA
jgi:glycosyltransferase involved in cell wall biosynthesis